MLSRIKTLTTLALAVCTLALTVADASALSGTDSNGGAVNATSASVTFEGSGISIVCPLTVELSLLRGPIAISRGSQWGEVGGVRIGSCTGGSVSGTLGMPWRVTLNDSLPTIMSLTTRNATGLLFTANGVQFNLSVFGGFVNCLYEGNAGWLMPLTHTFSGSATYTGRTLEGLTAVNLSLIRGGFGCPSTGHFNGNFMLATTQTIALA